MKEYPGNTNIIVIIIIRDNILFLYVIWGVYIHGVQIQKNILDRPCRQIDRDMFAELLSYSLHNQ